MNPMNDWNFMTAILIVALFVLWNIEFAATLLNLKAFPCAIPAELHSVMDATKLDQARDYLRVNSLLEVVKSCTSLGVLSVFWFGGGFGALDALARSLTPTTVAAGVVFLAALALGQALVGLPFSIYKTFIIEKNFGFNQTSPATFIMDGVKTLLLSAGIGLPLATAVLWIFGTLSHAWLWAWTVLTAFQLLLGWLAPALIMPLFNQFTPMPAGELKQSIEALGARCGFPLAGVFIMDGSKRSSKANAFFTGFGKQKKIALFDTLVDKSTTPELLGVLAHEIGHFRCGHIRQRLAAGILQSAVIFFLLGLATDPHGVFARLLFDAFHVPKISPHVGLVLFSILLEPISKLLDLALHAWSRHHEFEADAYAATATGDPTPLATALTKMSVDHLAHPTPAALRVWLDYSHPPLLQRLRALTAPPKATGGPTPS